MTPFQHFPGLREWPGAKLVLNYFRNKHALWLEPKDLNQMLPEYLAQKKAFKANARTLKQRSGE
jgi:hypothetical protein